MTTLAIGLVCASLAGPIIVSTAAPALAIAFWRNALAALAISPLVLFRARGELFSLSGKAIILAVTAGILLAVHFGTYVPSLRHTSVASSSALACTQAVWAALIGASLGQRMAVRGWLGTAIAFSGVLMVTGTDFHLSPESLLGNSLALAAGIFGGAYMVVGGIARRKTSTGTYTLLCYSVASLGLLPVCLTMSQQMWGYGLEDWGRIIALTVLAQLLGHTVFNLVVKNLGATVVSLSTMFTVPLAAVFAAVLVGQVPPPMTIPAIAVIIAGTWMVITSPKTPSGKNY